MTDKRTDSELVSAFKEGDKSGFVALLIRYTEKVHNLAMRITRNPEDAEEILQDVFLTIYNKIDMFEGKSAFSSWLYRITANTSFMKLRKRRQQAAVSLDDAGPACEDSPALRRSDTSDVDYMSSRHELRQALESAIVRLPDEYKTIFILRDVDGLSNQEVGDILNLSVAAVKSRLHRSRLMLRRKLVRYYNEYSNDDYIAQGRVEEESDQYQNAA